MRPSLRSISAVTASTLLVAAFVCPFSIGAGASSKRADGGFEHNGQPIHPMSVAPLLGDLASEQPLVAAVDLERSRQSKSHRAEVTVRGDTVRAEDGDGGYVAYRHVGTTPGGLQVLVVSQGGGGTGVFKDVLWVRLVKDEVSEDGKKRNRTLVLKCGGFVLGDRDDGLVRLDGAKLFIGNSKYRDHETSITLE